MTLIEGIGDEVTHFFIAVFVIIIGSMAWWTTSISEQRHMRTVLLLERRRHRTHRRLTTNTETVTITEGTNPLSTVVEEASNSTQNVESIEATNPEEKPPESSSSSDERSAIANVPGNQNTQESNLGEEENIINTMDSDTCALRQRRLAFYNNFNNDSQDVDPSQQSSQSLDLPQSSSSNFNEKNSEGLDETLEEVDSSEATSDCSGDKNGITIKLKYINDDVKLVDGKLDEALGDFKKRHFQGELASNKIIRLIFNGQVLQPDTQTLQACGLFDNCVVHCLIHQKRTTANQSTSETRRAGYSFPTSNGIHNLNNNNQNREWDLGNFLFAFISFILLAAWYFRYVYAHLYTVTATVGLILITGIFSIVLVGMYFPPDNENMPNLTIRIARERMDAQQQH